MTQGDTKYDEILERRARQLARAVDPVHERELDTVAAVVAVGPESFGIPVESLREIIAAPAITGLPYLPPWMRGIVQIRGELVSVVDTASWFGIAVSSPPAFLAVIEGSSGPLGLLVDAVLGFREFFVNEIATTFSRTDTTLGRPIRAITKDLVALVDTEGLLTSDKIIVDARLTSPDRAQGGLDGQGARRCD